MNCEGGSRLVSRKLIEAHEAERMRVARNLHDDIGQRMAVVTMDLDALARDVPLETTEARDRIRAVSDRTLALAKDIQTLSHGLYPPKLDYLGIVSASAALCRDMSDRQKVEVAFSHEGIPDGVPIAVALPLFRVLQEAVTNAVTHARADRVTVTLTGTPNEIRLEIVDAGTGFDVDAELKGRGLGLVGMQERARAANGELIIQSRPGAGTSISARVPISSGPSQLK